MMTNRRFKYNARRVQLNGFTFDSQAEARRYSELKLLAEAGRIDHLLVHPRFIIIDAAIIHGRRERPIEYEGDFQYNENGCIVVEDIKGMRTPVYRIKRRLFLQQYGHGIDFREIEA